MVYLKLNYYFKATITLIKVLLKVIIASILPMVITITIKLKKVNLVFFLISFLLAGLKMPYFILILLIPIQTPIIIIGV